MRKIRILSLLLAVLTIGGVYAAWTFADDGAIDRKGQSITVTLATKNETALTMGSFSLVPSDDFSISIDQMAEGDHRTKLVITGSIKIVFTPDPNAPIDIREHAVKAEYYFAVSESLKYTDPSDDVPTEKPIFTVATATHYDIASTDDAEAATKWTQNGNAFEYEITKTMLESYISMNVFSIDSSAEYATFNAILRDGNITLYINDKATPAA